MNLPLELLNCLAFASLSSKFHTVGGVTARFVKDSSFSGFQIEFYTIY